MLPKSMQELTAWPNWVISAADKILWRADGKGLASSTDPSTWATYEAACAALETCVAPGTTLGFVLTNTPFCVVDIDDPAKDKTRTPEQINWIIEQQTQVYNRIVSCTEQSFSGKGAHIFCRGSVPDGARLKEVEVEVFSTAKYFKITGNMVRDIPIVDCQELLTELYEEIRAAQGGSKTNGAIFESQPETRTDQQIYDAAAGAANGEKFKKLFAGDFREFYPSQSEADLALCNLLAFYTDSKEQTARMFMQSALGSGRDKYKKRPGLLAQMVAKSFDQKVPLIDLTAAKAHMADLMNQAAITPSAQVTQTKWTFPPGMVGQIAEFIYSAAWSPLPEVALAGAIAYYAGLVGRAFNVSGMGLNQYVVVLAKTGQGKDAAKTGIGKLNGALQTMLGDIRIENFMGPELIASAQGLLNRVSETPSCVSILPEFGKLLRGITDPRANATMQGILAALLKLYSASGKNNRIGASAYSDKAKNSTAIVSPNFTILGEGTPSSFYTAVSEDSVSDGFLPRLTLLEYEGDSPEPNESAEHAQPLPILLQHLQSTIRQVWASNSSNQVTNVILDAQAHDLSKQLREHCRGQINTHNANNADHLAEIWTRVHAKTLKLAALIAVGCDSQVPVINSAIFTWAADLVHLGTTKLVARFESGNVGNEQGDHHLLANMDALLRRYMVRAWERGSERNFRVSEQAKNAGAIHLNYIQRNLGALKEFRTHKMGALNAINQIVKAFEESGKLQKIPDGMEGIQYRQTEKGGLRTGRMWLITDL